MRKLFFVHYFVTLALMVSCQKDPEISVPQKSNNKVETFTQNSDWVSDSLAIVGGSYEDLDGLSITELGFFVGTNPDDINTKYIDSIRSPGFIYLKATQLRPTTTYYMKAYVTNKLGTCYGSVKSFTTKGAATLTFLVAQVDKKVPCFAYGLIKDGYLEIHAPAKQNFELAGSHGENNYLQLDIKLPNQRLKTGRYVLGVKDSSGQAYFKSYDVDWLNYEMITNTSKSGIIHIASIDSVKRLLSGTFYCLGTDSANAYIHHGEFYNVGY